ncbi:MAG: PorP/SprF family type IX secretion system membrane protein [Saprospiraceae bacterium]|nr:PorP/SprF family type IX secretion system membrane protein [Bacteroidia bacterium]NNE14908.1 PorP/SprF family type IX secretion system membrane protein [Saprospiraceae bacterium]NNL93385.1 PorP/SprF family type IX secretion system membrane protein [Saprospiraceae bacterium]
MGRATRQLFVKIAFFKMLCICYFNNIQAQDIIFSQYYNSPVHINPAFAGIVSYPNFTANHRSQWLSINKAYTTYAVTYDQHFKKMNSGLGFVALTDSQGNGSIKTTKFSGIYSYNVKFRRDYQIRFGLEAGFSQNRLDWDKLIFFDQIDIEVGPFDSAGLPFPSTEIRPDNLSAGYFDVGIGMLLYTPDFYVGFNIDHVNSPQNGYLTETNTGIGSNLPLLFSLNAGTQIVLATDNKRNPSTFISPNVIFALQSGFKQINFGAYLQKDILFGGAWLRHTIKNIDALIFSAGVNLDGIKISYSFDLTLSSLGNRSGGSHELGITIGLKKLEKKESKMNDCFSLFR